MSKLQKKALFFLIILVLLTPTGILLPMVFNAGDAWGEWSAETVKELIGYVPEGLQQYTDAYKAPVPDYTFDVNNTSATHQSFFYILSGLFGAAITLGVTVLISKLIVKK